jgi:hypothetical protein
MHSFAGQQARAVCALLLLLCTQQAWYSIRNMACMLQAGSVAG